MSGSQSTEGTVLVRTYVGAKLEDLVRAYWADARDLGDAGYEPVGQTYIEGRWSVWEILVAVLTIPIFVGVFLLAYLVTTKPTGSLLVTFVLRR